jgi:hypothetical protein
LSHDSRDLLILFDFGGNSDSTFAVLFGKNLRHLKPCVARNPACGFDALPSPDLGSLRMDDVCRSGLARIRSERFVIRCLTNPPQGNTRAEHYWLPACHLPLLQSQKETGCEYSDSGRDRMGAYPTRGHRAGIDFLLPSGSRNS